MLRGVLFIIIAICLVPGASAETVSERSTSSTWAAVIIPKGGRPTSPAIPVQDPYCEYGVGPCGGTCNEEGGKTWNCLAIQLPCYKGGGHCTCEVAGICKPPRH